MKYKLFLLCMLAFFLLPISGSLEAARPICRYVTEAQVEFYQPDRQQSLHYTDPSKLSSLLTCLRLAVPYGQMQTAEADPTAHHYCITLYYSDQTLQVYHLQDYRYLSKDGITWQKIPTKKVHYLYLLLHLLPPDT